MPTLRVGDRGSGVAEIRAILSARGLLDDPVVSVSDETSFANAAVPNAAALNQHGRAHREAVFDAACARAVQAFQQERGLIADGVVGPATYTALLEASYRLGSRVLLYRLSAPMSGDDVATLQSRLQNLGFYHGLVDGTFGATTHNAVVLYQGEYGLTPDGICGPETLKSLDRLGSRVTGGSPHAIREEEVVRRSGPRLTGKRILIDPGSAEDGAVGNALMWDLAARLEGRMSAAGMETFLSHDRESRPNDAERARVANLVGADLMISLRLAHYPNERANGVATFYYGTTHGSYSTIGRNLAGYLQREVVARTPLLDCRSHERTWSLLRLTRMPVVVLETGYITNPSDAQLLNDPEARDTIAEAILVAVKRLYLAGENDRPTGTYTFSDLLAAEEISY